MIQSGNNPRHNGGTTDNQLQEDVVLPTPHQHLGDFGLELSPDPVQRLSDSEPELLSHINSGPSPSLFATRQFPSGAPQGNFFPQEMTALLNQQTQQQHRLMQQQHQRPLSTQELWPRQNPVTIPQTRHSIYPDVIQVQNGIQNLSSSTSAQVALVSRSFDTLPTVDALRKTASTATSSVPFSPLPTPTLTRTSVNTSRKRRLRDSDVNESTPRVKHVYTQEQDCFLASKILIPRINEILQGANQAFTPKSKVHEEIAAEFNSKFGTTLDAAQIKNKLANMRKIWNDTNKQASPTKNEGLNYEMSKVLKRCPFYYALEPIWSVSRSPVSRRHTDSSAKLTDDDDDDDDDTDEVRNEGQYSFMDVRMRPQKAADCARETKTRRTTSQTQHGDPIDAGKLSEVSIIEQEHTKRMLAELTCDKEVRIEKETTKREKQREATKREKQRLEHKIEKKGKSTKIQTHLDDTVEGSLGGNKSKVSSIEQELTKRTLARLCHEKEVRIEKETTRREEHREETKREQLRLEHEREISKRLELEMQLQQSEFRHPRMEMERNQQSNTAVSLFLRRTGQQTDMTPVTDGMEGLSAQ